MTKSICLSNKMFYDSFGYFVLDKTIPKVEFYALQLEYVYLSYLQQNVHKSSSSVKRY